MVINNLNKVTLDSTNMTLLNTNLVVGNTTISSGGVTNNVGLSLSSTSGVVLDGPCEANNIITYNPTRAFLDFTLPQQLTNKLYVDTKITNELVSY